jgi:hypothetical protein
MAFQLVDYVQVAHPLPVAINAANICIPSALMAHLALQQAVIYCVLHVGGSVRLGDACGKLYEVARRVGGRQSRSLTTAGVAQASQSGVNLSRSGRLFEGQTRIAALSQTFSERCVCQSRWFECCRAGAG